mmetsp:Transcript_39747/g.65079  ORF Transcript_39747/g.65079 Transcript_39747/m.65079 type:complete len:186 (-) Transcript_39747:168-725(-)|eukprot:CAMPEP_0202687702 /NCGR_PEP_ID=MMETSP1385-20130828/3354_1 /ASSEMBLY_ACC=CAM_ASM_000861 /TAXON_ID=933848 /ORGANISM="Elphidium margaritaceum" /LENGTH=185 /DNA_ID=CAMNT_0049342539 /DNA_START=44 /DNA_END=601 /DNA_ORIENTATION=+
MLKKFSIDQISSSNRAKTSISKKLRKQIIDLYPMCEDFMDDTFPKKGVMNLTTSKAGGTRFTFIMDEEFVAWFFQMRNGAPIPTLRLLHQFPDMLPRFQVDEGAIKFVLRGSDIFCAGLTSKGGNMVEVEEETVVAIYAEGKQHACSIGLTTMSTEQIRKVNAGVGVNQIHYMCDGFWQLKTLES